MPTWRNISCESVLLSPSPKSTHKLLRKISASWYLTTVAQSFSISLIMILLLSSVTISNLSTCLRASTPVFFLLHSQQVIMLDPSQRNDRPSDLELHQLTYIPIHPLLLSFFWSLSHLMFPQRPPIKWYSLYLPSNEKKSTFDPFPLSTFHYVSPYLHSQTSLKK